MPQDSKSTGNAPNQFAQVGMGGSQGGGQFEQGDGQSGSLQDGQRGTTTTRPVPADGDGDFAGQHGAEHAGAQPEQDQPRQDRSPGSSDESEASGAGRTDDRSGSGA